MALADELRKVLGGLGVADTQVAWAGRLDIDPPTLTKLLKGKLTLTPTRAAKWAEAVFPADPAKQEQFVASLLASLEVSGPTVAQFCDRVVAEMGAVPAERIGELFTALCAVSNPLVCVVYRDMPRAGPDAKYPGLGQELAKAVGRGMNYAMFLPFGANIPPAPQLGDYSSFDELMNDSEEAPAPAARTTAFMEEIGEACRGAFLSFERDAIAEHMTISDKSETAARAFVRDRLRLYEAASCGVCTGGFCSKIFYIQWDDGPTFHKRIFEWVSTPTRDWLLYRGDANIHPEALRDSLYPVPHLFDLSASQEAGPKRLPSEIHPVSNAAKYQELWEGMPGFRHPKPGAWNLSSICQ